MLYQLYFVGLMSVVKTNFVFSLCTKCSGINLSLINNLDIGYLDSLTLKQVPMTTAVAASLRRA